MDDRERPVLGNGFSEGRAEALLTAAMKVVPSG
jgi:hypothetical protein